MNNFQPHLKISARDISPYVLLPGDPARVDEVGKFLENFKIIANNREFKLGVGDYRGVQVTVCSTGIGGPSTAIAVEELINAGAKYLIRIGTCGGSWRANIPLGSLVVPTACVRDEGTTAEYIPSGFPAVADYRVVNALASARTATDRIFVGINRTHDAFYSPLTSITKWGSYLLDERYANCDTPILSSDMETSILYVVASLRGVAAGAVLAVNADPLPLRTRLGGEKQIEITENSIAQTEDIVKKMIVVALSALINLKQYE